MLSPTAASGDIGISLSRHTVTSGGVLMVTVSGYIVRPTRFPIYVAPLKRALRPHACGAYATCAPTSRFPAPHPPFDLLGTILARPSHIPSARRLRIPHVPPGRYELFLWCGHCVTGPRGSLIGDRDPIRGTTVVRVRRHPRSERRNSSCPSHR